MRLCLTRTAVFFFLSFHLFHLPVSAEFNLLYQKNGTAIGGGFGWSVAGAGDVDGDGTPDFIIGAPYVTPSVGRDYAGAVFVYSGATGSLLYQKSGFYVGENVGLSVAGPGDMDGDGKTDFLVNGITQIDYTYFSSVFLYSGATSSLIYRKTGTFPENGFGSSIAETGDIDRDSVPDFVVGAYAAGGGAAYVYSGVSGSLLYQKFGIVSGEWFGYSVAGSGDVDGDGIPDFIIGAPLASPGGRRYAGSAFVYSGATGLLLYQKNGDSAESQLGLSVAGAGDINGDGRDDFIVGAPFSSPGGRFQAGSAYLYSGATGLPLYQVDGDSTNDFFGFSVAGVGDIDGDQIADFGVGPGLYSGATGLLLFQKVGANSVAGVGDLNEDGRADFIIGSPGAGSAYVYILPCPARGDMNADSSLTASDVMLLLNCVFLNTGICGLCFADINCDGQLAPADVVLELLGAILRRPLPC